MEKVCLGAPTVSAAGAENGDAGMHNYLRAAALADQEQRQRWQFIAQAYNILAAGCSTAREPGALPEAVSRPVFAGGRLYTFGPFRIFPSQRLLLEGNRKVQLGSRAFDILTILVERAGEVVGKNELIARVWPDVVVAESNLKTQVSALRRSLGEAPLGKVLAGTCYIVTIPGRGYNFVAPVSVAEDPLLDGPASRHVYM
ncbi:MAG: transcriptional regulator [Rhodopila sp.]|jgi:DNA-binding winged helix-turn-helix (wHTH) protein